MNKFLPCALLAAAVCQSAVADEFVAGNQFGVILGGAFTFGGDEMAKYSVEYGDDDEGNESIKAGEQFLFYVGGYYQHNQSPDLSFGAQLTYGYMFDSIDAKNGSVTLDRFPLEFIPYVKLSNFRLGLGLTKHTNLTFEDDAVLNFKIDGEDATGTIILLEYMFGEHVAIGLRYVNIDYDFKTPYGTLNYDASHAGIGAAYLF